MTDNTTINGLVNRLIDYTCGITLEFNPPPKIYPWLETCNPIINAGYALDKGDKNLAIYKAKLAALGSHKEDSWEFSYQSFGKTALHSRSLRDKLMEYDVKVEIDGEIMDLMETTPGQTISYIGLNPNVMKALRKQKIFKILDEGENTIKAIFDDIVNYYQSLNFLDAYSNSSTDNHLNEEVNSARREAYNFLVGDSYDTEGLEATITMDAKYRGFLTRAECGLRLIEEYEKGADFFTLMFEGSGFNIYNRKNMEESMILISDLYLYGIDPFGHFKANIDNIISSLLRPVDELLFDANRIYREAVSEYAAKSGIDFLGFAQGDESFIHVPIIPNVSFADNLYALDGLVAEIRERTGRLSLYGIPLEIRIGGSIVTSYSNNLTPIDVSRTLKDADFGNMLGKTTHRDEMYFEEAIFKEVMPYYNGAFGINVTNTSQNTVGSQTNNEIIALAKIKDLMKTKDRKEIWNYVSMFWDPTPYLNGESNYAIYLRIAGEGLVRTSETSAMMGKKATNAISFDATNHMIDLIFTQIAHFMAPYEYNILENRNGMISILLENELAEN
jgi:hypothetical protein